MTWWKVLYPMAPAVVLITLTFFFLGVFAIRVKIWGYPDMPDADRRGTTAIATPFIQRYLFWCVQPLERFLARFKISPNSITLASLAVCGLVGALAMTHRFAAAAWCYILAGLLDILDGRVARRTGKSSAAGAFLDSVSDRWGEFLAIGGIALATRDGLGITAVIVCLMGSSMVSYTRARGESLGLSLSGGTMQRGERMFGVSISLLAGAIGRHTHLYNGELYVSMGVMLIGVWATFTAVARLWTGFRDLRAKELAATSLPAVRQEREQRKHSAASSAGSSPSSDTIDRKPKQA